MAAAKPGLRLPVDPMPYFAHALEFTICYPVSNPRCHPMKHAKKIFNILFLSLLFTLTSSASFAKDCDTCTKPQVASDMSDADLGKLSQRLEDEGGMSFETTLDGRYDKFAQILAHEVNGFLRDLDSSPYPAPAYFQKAHCIAKNGEGQSPLLHLIADAPCHRVEFAKKVHTFFTVKHKDPESWLKAVNAKNRNGETLLDFIAKLTENDRYANEESLKCANEITNFICSTGAKYSKFASEKSCR